jgi:hypothetical protein
MRFAAAVHELAARHWVQTPYRYFPVEPHWLFPGFQFLPLIVKAEVSRHWPLVHTRSASREEGLRAAIAVELLSWTEMCLYFPGSQIQPERMAGLVKSLIAVSGAATAGQDDRQLANHVGNQRGEGAGWEYCPAGGGAQLRVRSGG